MSRREGMRSGAFAEVRSQAELGNEVFCYKSIAVFVIFERDIALSVVDRLLALYTEKGQGAYFGEAVTETAHALQCAHLAEQSGADDALVAAALLHDIGHLLHNLPEDIAEDGTDGQHEEGGARFLQRYFASAVVDPI